MDLNMTIDILVTTGMEPSCIELGTVKTCLSSSFNHLDIECI